MIKILKEKVIKKVNSKKGAVSIIMVIFLLTISIAFTLLIDLSTTMFGMKEIQSKMDIAGINALYNSVDYTYLRDEALGIQDSGHITSGGASTADPTKYVDKIRANYINELQSIDYPGTNPVVRKSEVRFEYSNFGVGYNGAAGSTSGKSKPQVVLESIVSYEVPSSTFADEVTRKLTKSVKSTYSNSSFSATVEDGGQDGKTTVMLHSMTRVILK